MSSPWITGGVIDYRRLLSQGLDPLDLYDARGHLGTTPGSELAEQVRVRAGSLAARGLRRGDRVVLVATNTPEFLTTLLATFLLGATPCSVAPPSAPSRRDSGNAHLEAAIRVVDPGLIVAPAESTGSRPAAPATVTLEELRDGPPLPPEEDLRPPGPGDVHHIQLTSGSTSAPKAVLLSHANVAHNIAVMARAMDVAAHRDRLFNWLPLYHDMGLILVLGALLHGVPTALMAPMSFLRDPLSWLVHMTRHGSTLTAGPPFAYRAAVGALARAADSSPQIDLSAVRFAYVGAEPIPYQTLRQFHDAFTPRGLRPDALVPCYGMAESVLATTVAFRTGASGPADFGRVRVRDERARTAAGETRAGDVRLVSCGAPVENMQVQVVDDSGADLGPGRIGDIVISGPSVMLGYREADGTVTRPPNGRHHTGDRGFLADGELFVVGRTKEMLIVRGRNFPPYDVERAIETLPGLGPGTAVVFSVPDRRPGREGGEAVVAVVGTAPAAGDPSDLEAGIGAAVRRAFGFSPDDVVVIPRRRIPRTTSGKPQRLEVRDRYLAGLL